MKLEFYGLSTDRCSAVNLLLAGSIGCAHLCCIVVDLSKILKWILKMLFIGKSFTLEKKNQTPIFNWSSTKQPGQELKY